MTAGDLHVLLLQSFELDAKVHIAIRNHVLNLEIFQCRSGFTFSWRLDFHHGLVVDPRRLEGSVFTPGPRDDHLTRGEDQSS